MQAFRSTKRIFLRAKLVSLLFYLKQPGDWEKPAVIDGLKTRSLAQEFACKNLGRNGQSPAI
ncbi:hypothetical protein AAW28_09675 [Lacticaseibacillus casei]|nr:hypothetical protein AAW28_09675 [Lacticaseibacillus casei]